MIPRNLIMPVALAAVVGIPLLMFQTAGDQANSATTASSHPFDPSTGITNLFAENDPSTFIPISDLSEIIRFDIYPNWVKSRWPRVSTAPVGDGLQGMRVALVTGSNRWDICGSLTYYFDENMRVQRISLVGDTGDASLIVRFLVERFQFKVQPTRAAGLLTASVGRKPIGVLRLENPPVIEADNPQQQVHIVLELNNPDGSLGLSQSMTALAQTGL